MSNSVWNPECGAYFGTGDGGARCRRPEGHPPVNEDGIGHSAEPLSFNKPTKGRYFTEIPPTFNMDDFLNKRAEEGWELVCVDQGIVYWKRPA